MTGKSSLSALFTILMLTAYLSSFAQTKAEGPWWPHAIWGAGDQAGGSNWITPEKIMESIKLVRTGKLYELGQVYERGMPLFGQRTYALHSVASPSGGPFGENNLIYNDEHLSTEIGQVGTQFDGPGHIGTRLKMADGSEEDVYYNGFTGKEMYSPYGLRKLGVENIKPFITRGILVDIAGYKGVATLPKGYEVTLADVKGALSKQGVAETGIQNGDAIFFNYGWSKLWSTPEKYNDSPPGIGMEVAQWVVDKNASMIGSDQFGTEVSLPPDAPLSNPVHQLLITQNGIFNLENMVFESLIEDGQYEFLFIFTPVRFKGATGSPGRPIAIR